MIVAENVSYEYPTVRALDGVSLRVERGEIAALVGPNGAGKTTLLRCLAALERPYSGTVSIDGLDTQVHPRNVHARIGYLPDFFGLYDELTVEQSLTFAARSHDISSGDAPAAVQKAAERVGLTDRMKDKAGHLSRGLRQRLAIGQAIVHEPRVLLLDEPASGLDPQARRDLSNLFLSLRDLGITQLISSHILAELSDYCTFMVSMSDGKIVSTRAVTGADKDGRMALRIDLSVPNDSLGDVLSATDGVTVLEAQAGHAVVVLDGVERPALLRALLNAGFEVSGISEQKQSLEDAYFQDIKASGRS